VIAVLFDAARFVFKNESWLEKSVLALYSTGSLGLIAAFVSGRQAVDTVTVFGDAIPVVTSHEDWALYTMIYFLIFTAIRWFIFVKKIEKGFLLPLFVVIGLGGSVMLWQTGELGSKLVYKHGVAVSETNRLQDRIEQLERDLASMRGDIMPVSEENGWIWRISPGAGQVIHDAFTIDSENEIQAETAQSDGITHLKLNTDGYPVFLIYPGSYSAIDGRTEISLTDFEGEFKLIHHYQNPENYQYLRVTGQEMSQGQVINGSDNILGRGTIQTDEWLTIRVTASGAHFYGYSGGSTVVHTHADEMTAGDSGIFFKGTGSIRIRTIAFSSPQ
jgi:uncharacterized membrane protein